MLDAIDSTFVSSVGQYVDRFERDLAAYTGAAQAVATVNGTAALQAALSVVGVKNGDEVITQPLTFVATANAVSHLCAHPVFVDVDQDTMGLSPGALEQWLAANAQLQHDPDGTIRAYNVNTNRRIAAILPMHTFGHPCRIKHIVDIAGKWDLPVVEDAAEALGSFAGSTHCGLFGDLGIVSFNGNKTITCGGGGAILSKDANLASRAKHLTTTAKVPHPWEFDHDAIGYNFRMPNLNAALACAQLERLPDILREKRQTAQQYKAFFAQTPWANFVEEPTGTWSNYWLCAIALKDPALRNDLLEHTNQAGVMTRPVWKLMPELDIYQDCQCGPIQNAVWLRERVVNLPSGVRSGE